MGGELGVCFNKQLIGTGQASRSKLGCLVLGAVMADHATVTFLFNAGSVTIVSSFLAGAATGFVFRGSTLPAEKGDDSEAGEGEQVIDIAEVDVNHFENCPFLLFWLVVERFVSLTKKMEAMVTIS